MKVRGGVRGRKITFSRSEKIRFRSGQPQKIGGWVKYSITTINGKFISSSNFIL